MSGGTRGGAWLRGAAWAAALLIALWILSLTLVEAEQPGGVNLVPFSEKLPALNCLLGGCTSRTWQEAAAVFLFVDLLGNVAVFVPLGAALAVALFPRRARGRPRFGFRWWRSVAGVGFLLSLGIEIAQLSTQTRTTDVDDVILNTLGALVGAAAVRLISVFI